jgi:predicted acyl esterase
MKHHALEQLQIVAEVDQDYPRQTMSRSERLERWAQLLERNPDRRLATLHQTENQPAWARAAMREYGSPISVAFEDPVLRAAGLENDSYGEARRFFELTDRQLHEVICYCHFGAMVNAATAAHYIRKVLPGKQRGMFARLHEMFVG